MQAEEEQYLKIIYQSPIIFKIKEIALTALKIFKEEVKKKYPQIQIETDTQVIIKEAIDSLVEAIRSLFKDEKEEKRNIPYWSVGYVLGFFSSNLWSHWKGEYLYPKTKEYQNLMFLKSIFLYSKVDSKNVYQFISTIQKIYDCFISDQFNPNYIANTEDNIISLENFKKKKGNFAHKEFANSLINYLESLLLQEHYKAFDNITINGNLKDIQNLFEDDEINELINFTKQQLSDKPN
ncbi:hypothetical protein [Candidatus Tisiphia endosymbiont of Micropterix aruncella]|uniref:hypothetical protein n=1 Tax=Candidatus Tisiphia endosymbiont of Micropterix aruncella TaxID=3066271 RepID=UPI003AA96618